MFSAIYIEKDILQHPRVIEIRERFQDLPHIPIERYGEVFNRKSQNFRLQKKLPALILSSKHENFVLKAPDSYGFGGNHNYYFSHIMNCIYDCRYCFLQGMYRSAHYVLFVNYEDFGDSLREIINNTQDTGSNFYSGYDCDSLALEPVSHFSEYILPLFQQYPSATLELRTKSTQIRTLLNLTPIDNVVVAYSFTPDEVSRTLEHKVPSLVKRLQAMAKLQEKGWKIGLRFEPVLVETHYQEHYSSLFKTVFSAIQADKLHSVSLGMFRMPDNFYKNIVKLYPDEKLFAGPLYNHNGLVAYQEDIENEVLHYCQQTLLEYIPASIYYTCRN